MEWRIVKPNEFHKTTGVYIYDKKSNTNSIEIYGKISNAATLDFENAIKHLRLKK